MNYAIIVAAGRGKRMGKSKNKVFLPLLSKPVIYYAIRNFQGCRSIDEIAIVAKKSDIQKINEIKNQHGFGKIKNIVHGGKERQDSVYKGLLSLKDARTGDIIVVHNGSNPLAKHDEIVGCINAAKKYGAAAAGFPLKDTIKKTGNGFVEKTIDRASIYQVQTPQAVEYSLLVKAFENAKRKNLKVTDDVSLAEALGKKAKIVPCSYENIKITTQDDLKIAEGILMRRENKSKNADAGFRVGFGHDSHEFSKNKGKKLVLCNYAVPNEAGLEGNSDGDVVLHALFNAISSAIGDKSLGHYADSMCMNGVTDSKEYIKVILGKLSQKNMKISNVSISIEAGTPRLEAHTDKMRHSLSKILKLGKENIGVTYTSGENLTAFGKGKGMQCFAAVSLRGFCKN